MLKYKLNYGTLYLLQIMNGYQIQRNVWSNLSMTDVRIESKIIVRQSIIYNWSGLQRVLITAIQCKKGQLIIQQV